MHAFMIFDTNIPYGQCNSSNSERNLATQTNRTAERNLGTWLAARHSLMNTRRSNRAPPSIIHGTRGHPIAKAPN